jgi:hypothetical protein
MHYSPLFSSGDQSSHFSLSSSTLLTTLTRTQTGLYAIGLTTNLRGYRLTILSLNPVTGELIAREDLPGATFSGPDDFVVLKQGTVGPNGKEQVAQTAGLVWLHGGAVKETYLSPGLEGKFLGRVNANKYGPYTSIKGYGVEGKGFFVAVLQGKDKEDAGAHMYRMEVNGMGLVKSGEFSPVRIA